MKIKWGRGHLKARVVATYTRMINGKRHTSHHIPALDKQRFGKFVKNRKLHHREEHFTDLEGTNL
jgi:hypothetical protein